MIQKKIVQIFVKMQKIKYEKEYLVTIFLLFDFLFDFLN